MARPRSSSRAVTLRNIGLRVLDLKDTRDANVDARDELCDLAHFLTDNLPRFQGQVNAQLSQILSDILGDISGYEKELEELGKGSKSAVTLADRHRVRVATYTRELKAAWLRYETDVLADLSEAEQKRVSSEQPKEPSIPIPIEDLPAVLPPNASPSASHEEDLNGLVDLICTHPAAHAVILGGPGTGKTALAANLMRDPGVELRFANRRYFVACEGVGSAEGVTAALAGLFNVSARPGTTLQQALLNHLRSLGTSVLIVLDGLESAWDTEDQNGVEVLISHLCGVERLSVLVTMRGTSPPYGPRWHRILVLKSLSSGTAVDS